MLKLNGDKPFNAGDNLAQTGVNMRVEHENPMLKFNHLKPKKRVCAQVNTLVSRTDTVDNLDTTATNDGCYFRLKNGEKNLRTTNIKIEEALTRYRIKKILYG